MKHIVLSLSLVFFLLSCSSATITDKTSQENIPTPSLEKKTILALGDSLTAGYGVERDKNYPSKLQEKLDTDGYNYEVVNAGVSGDTSENVLDRAPLYLDQDIDTLILVVGGNDGLRGLSTKDMKTNILKVIDMYQEKGIMVVLGGMDVPINLGLDYRADFRQVYKDIEQERDVYFLKFFLDGVAGDSSLNLPDRIHPTPEGYDIIVDNLYQFLLTEDILKK